MVGAGLGGHNERGLDVEPTTNVEALFQFWTSFYIYNRPKTNFDVSLQSCPSLSDTGRQRVQLGAAAKRKLWKDLFVATRSPAARIWASLRHDVRFRNGAGDAPVLRLLWRKEGDAWRVTSYDVELP